uniref:Putative rho/rac guanine nucleotide exchange factor/faciogenital dysplasia protein 3 n=1 Tax=Triatoma infestans TaxID=30076 RepID=A0A023F0M9_TRIIF
MCSATAPSTPSLSSELRALIEQRNVLTTRSKSRVIRDLTRQIQQDNLQKEVKLKAKAVEEIFTSEVSYLNQLEIAMKYFKDPLLKSNLKLPDALKVMLVNLESVYNVNGELLNELRRHGEDVASAFITVAPFFKLYSVYAYDYRHGIIALQELSKTNSKLDAFIKKQETRPEVNSKLCALLIAPIQRIPRYRLLLKELLSHTPTSHPHHASIMEAIRKVEASTEHINSLVYEQENMQRIVELQKSLCGSKPVLVHPGRKLIKEGILQKVSKKSNKPCPRYVVLLSDILMYCKMTGVPLGDQNSLRCSCVLPLRRCTVQQGNRIFSVTCQTLTIVLYSDQESCTTESWFEAINSAIMQDAQHRQTLNRRGSSRQVLKKKDLNFMSDALTPRKRKQLQEDTDDVCAPFHSPWKRNKITSSCASSTGSSSTSPSQENLPPKRQGYISSIKKAISNFGHSLQKYWFPIYTGRENSGRHITS